MDLTRRLTHESELRVLLCTIRAIKILARRYPPQTTVDIMYALFGLEEAIISDFSHSTTRVLLNMFGSLSAVPHHPH
jgi:hypothetical protein